MTTFVVGLCSVTLFVSLLGFLICVLWLAVTDELSERRKTASGNRCKFCDSQTCKESSEQHSDERDKFLRSIGIKP